MTAEKFTWLRTKLQLKGSVMKAIYKHILWCGAFGFLISLLDHFEMPVSQPILGSVIPSIVLGLLLVFRTNTAYERFWEGRKCWGSLVNNIRNLARQIWVSIDEILPEDKDNKITALNLLVAFAVTTKLHLRGEAVNSELEDLMPSTKYIKLKIMNNPPIEVAFWIGDYLQGAVSSQLP